MTLLAFIVLFSFLASIGAVTVAAVLLLLGQEKRARVVPALTSFAAGVLLASATVGLLPEAASKAGIHYVMETLLAGLFLFFALEKLLLWRHCHDEECETHGEMSGVLVLIGDAFHNFVDGVILSLAFLSGKEIGYMVAAAVIAHEVPQEIGDFAVLLHSGLPPRKAYGLNVLSSTTTFAGALLGYFFLPLITPLLPYVMALAAASFLYVAMADIIPVLHRETSTHAVLIQLMLMLTGAITIIAIHH